MRMHVLTNSDAGTFRRTQVRAGAGITPVSPLSAAAFSSPRRSQPGAGGRYFRPRSDAHHDPLGNA
jgi:hypothetical protein